MVSTRRRGMHHANDNVSLKKQRIEEVLKENRIENFGIEEVLKENRIENFEIEDLPEDVLGHILSFVPVHTVYTSKLVSKLWKSVIEKDSRLPSWNREGPWLLLLKHHRGLLRPIHSVSCRDADRKHFNKGKLWCNPRFLHSSHGLCLHYVGGSGIGGQGAGVYMRNPLHDEVKLLMRLDYIPFSCVQLVVPNPCGAYKVVYCNNSSTNTYNPFTDEWERVGTAQEFRERGFSGCLLAAFTQGSGLSEYLTQFILDAQRDIGPMYWANSRLELRVVFPDDVSHVQNKKIKILQTNGDQHIAAVITREFFALGLRVYEFRLAVGETLALEWKMLGSTVLSRTCRGAIQKSLTDVHVVCAEGMVVAWKLGKAQIRPSILNLKTLTWTKLPIYTNFLSLFQPNPLAWPVGIQ